MKRAFQGIPTLTTKPLLARRKYIWEEVEEELRAILIYGQDLFCDRKIRGTKETRHSTDARPTIMGGEALCPIAGEVRTDGGRSIDF
jgi:hypothetical protein